MNETNTMATSSMNIVALYHFLMSLGDPRVNEWPLMETPFPTLGILTVYLLVVFLGPKLMRNRRPVECRTVLILYNTFLVIACAYLFKELFQIVTLAKYNLLCEPVDQSNSPLGLRMVRVVWLGFMSKLFELLDTVFFVLRKKDSQVTFLHVYHHWTIVVNCWIGCKYVPGGHSYLIGAANSFVHVIMYTYYALSALGPKAQKYLWWKRHLTQLQLVQFILIITHVIIGLWMDCGYPKPISIYQLVYTILMALLFVNFYVQAYLKKQSAAKKKM